MLHTPNETLAEPRTAATGEAGIRPFVHDDATEVAALLKRAFSGSSDPAPEGMADYLRQVYLDAPGVDPDLRSLVFALSDGRIAGFIGVTTLPLRLGNRRLRAGVTSSLAVDATLADPMTGPRLLRATLASPVDAFVSDRCNAVSTALLKPMGGKVMLNYSLDWLRVIRPAGLALEALSRRAGPLRLAAPLIAPLDAAAMRRAQSADQAVWSSPARNRAAERLVDQPATFADLVGLIPDLLAHYALRPDWSSDQLLLLLQDGARKAEYGDFAARIVTTTQGKVLGIFLLHAQKGRTAEVLQMLTAPGCEGLVIDRAIAHAAAQGATAIRGRATPNDMAALTERRAVFLPELSTVVCTRDSAILDAFESGDAFFTGLAGENWMRLNGDRF